MMEQSRTPKIDIKKELLHLLQAEEVGKTPYQVAKALNISRQTASKYLMDLENENIIKKVEIGHYNLYRIVRKKDIKLVEKLYFLLLSIVGKYHEIDNKILEFLLTQIQLTKFEFVKDLDISKQAKIYDLQNQEKTYENLLSLLEGVRYLLYYFIPVQSPFKIDVIPASDRIQPMSLEIRIEDPGFLLNQAGIHFYIISSLIQEYLSMTSHENVYFRVLKPLEEQAQFVYFELGYVDKYYQDFSIFELNSDDTMERDLLDEIKQFYGSGVKMNTEENEIDGKLHYKFIFDNNQDLEHLYEITVHVLEETANIGKQILAETPGFLKRKWIPIENWSKPPFAVIECISNIGYIVDEHVRVSMESYKFGGICIHFERIENGWRINCLERVDFDQLFTRYTDWNKRSEIYAKLISDPEEFLKRRKDIIAKLNNDHDKKKLELI